MNLGKCQLSCKIDPANEVIHVMYDELHYVGEAHFMLEMKLSRPEECADLMYVTCITP